MGAKCKNNSATLARISSSRSSSLPIHFCTAWMRNIVRCCGRKMIGASRGGVVARRSRSRGRPLAEAAAEGTPASEAASSFW